MVSRTSYLKAKARFWPRLSFLFCICSTAVKNLLGASWLHFATVAVRSAGRRVRRETPIAALYIRIYPVVRSGAASSCCSALSSSLSIFLFLARFPSRALSLALSLSPFRSLSLVLSHALSPRSRAVALWCLTAFAARPCSLPGNPSTKYSSLGGVRAFH